MISGAHGNGGPQEIELHWWLLSADSRRCGSVGEHPSGPLLGL